MKKSKYLLLLFITAFIFPSRVLSQNDIGPKIFIMGSNLEESYSNFFGALASQSNSSQVRIVFLPVAYASNPLQILGTEKNSIKAKMDILLPRLEKVCQQVVPATMQCQLESVPIFTRSDAENPDLMEAFQEDIGGIVLLGDHAYPDSPISGTLLEKEMEAAYRQGVILAAAGFTGRWLTKYPAANYQIGYANNNALQFGAVAVGRSPDNPDITFINDKFLVDLWESPGSDFARLLNLALLPDTPGVAIGVDPIAGFSVDQNNIISSISGPASMTILDAETYHAADSVTYHLLDNQPSISARNILVHTVTGEKDWYDLKTGNHSLGSYPPFVERGFEGLSIPPGAGPILLAGYMDEQKLYQDMVTRFINLAGGKRAEIVVAGIGVESENELNSLLDGYAQIALSDFPRLLLSAQSDEPSPIPDHVTGIFLISGSSHVPPPPGVMSPLIAAWQRGAALFVEPSAVQLIGKSFLEGQAPPAGLESTAETPPSDALTPQLPYTILEGYGLVDANIQPQVLSAQGWERLKSLALKSPAVLALGLSDNVCLELTSQPAIAHGSGHVLVLDLRTALLPLDEAHPPSFANGLIDIFASQELILPVRADTNLAPVPMSTPILTPLPPTPTPTYLPTATASPAPPTEILELATPTRTPRPTRTPVPVPPPADPQKTNLMILLGSMAVIIVLLGIWLNRNRFK